MDGSNGQGERKRSGRTTDLRVSERRQVEEKYIIMPPSPPPLPLRARSGCPHLAGISTATPAMADWHDGSVWPRGRVPLSGENVSLPASRRVLLSRTHAPVLGLLTIPASSELIFGENEHGVELSAHGIEVKGAMRAGSATCRLLTRVTITLHGRRPASRAERENMPASSKGIYVTGVLSLHGHQFHTTWARLARSVHPGDTTVFLQQSVNWEVGQQVLLTTSALKDSRDWHRNEVQTLAEPPQQSTSSSLTALHLAGPTLFAHESNAAYSAEVALLTRLIKIQGAAGDSEPTDTTLLSCHLSDFVAPYYSPSVAPCAHSFLTGYGGHILVAGSRAVAHVAGVELFRMGQTNLLGR